MKYTYIKNERDRSDMTSMIYKKETKISPSLLRSVLFFILIINFILIS